MSRKRFISSIHLSINTIIDRRSLKEEDMWERRDTTGERDRAAYLSSETLSAPSSSENLPKGRFSLRQPIQLDAVSNVLPLILCSIRNHELESSRERGTRNTQKTRFQNQYRWTKPTRTSVRVRDLTSSDRAGLVPLFCALSSTFPAMTPGEGLSNSHEHWTSPNHQRCTRRSRTSTCTRHAHRASPFLGI